MLCLVVVVVDYLYYYVVDGDVGCDGGVGFGEFFEDCYGIGVVEFVFVEFFVCIDVVEFEFFFMG